MDYFFWIVLTRIGTTTIQTSIFCQCNRMVFSSSNLNDNLCTTVCIKICLGDYSKPAQSLFTFDAIDFTSWGYLTTSQSSWLKLSPSWPKWLNPHEYRLPLMSKAKLWYLPQAIYSIFNDFENPWSVGFIVDDDKRIP